MFPDIILGISLLLLFILFDFELGFYTLLISHITLALPFATITVFSGFRGLNKNIIEVGRDLGASDYDILKKLIIPIISPNIIAAFLIAFTLSLDDVLVSYFVSGPQYEILPLTIFSLARMGTKPEVNAICTLMLLISVFLIMLSQILLRKKDD
jgi:spermidine/putrescine transport system permease protein